MATGSSSLKRSIDSSTTDEPERTRPRMASVESSGSAAPMDVDKDIVKDTHTMTQHKDWDRQTRSQLKGLFKPTSEDHGHLVWTFQTLIKVSEGIFAPKYRGMLPTDASTFLNDHPQIITLILNGWETSWQQFRLLSESLSSLLS